MKRLFILLPILPLLVACLLASSPLTPPHHPPPSPIVVTPSATNPLVYCVWVSGGLNVRSGPGVEYTSRAILWRGECVHLLDKPVVHPDGSVWQQVAPGLWVNTYYLEP